MSTTFSKQLAISSALLFFLSVAAIDLHASEAGKPLVFGTPHFSYDELTDLDTQTYTSGAVQVAGYQIAAMARTQQTNDAVTESTGTGGTQQTTTTSTPQLPDFIISDIKIEKRAGDIGPYVYVTVKNIGATAVPANVIFNARVEDLDSGWSDTAADTTDFVSGYTKDLATAYPLQRNSTGVYRIKATADTLGNFVESNETNNSLTETITLLPDLYLEFAAVQYDFDVTSGLPLVVPSSTQLWFDPRILNLGLHDSVPTTMQVYLDGIVQQTLQVPAIGSNGSGGSTTSFVFVPTKPSQLLTFTVDPSNTLAETNESNNTWSLTVKVQNPPTAVVTETKVAVCHYNKGSKAYSELKISKDAWTSAHSLHQGDFIKTGDGSCASLAPERPVAVDIVDGPRTLPITPEPQRLATERQVSGRIYQRIQKLGYQPSALEEQVIQHERKSETTVNPELIERVAGKIVLKVKNNGEAFYVDPDTKQKFYLKDGASAFTALQAFGTGITNQDIDQIPVNISMDMDTDSDSDGLSDPIEQALGTDSNNNDSDADGYDDGIEVKNGYHPRRTGSWKANQDLCTRLEGKILLQVQNRGQAWYVHNCQRHYLRNGERAYQIMRSLGLGITNEDLYQIPTGDFGGAQ